MKGSIARRAAVAAVTLTATLAGMATLAGAAHAATYTVYSCTDPADRPAGLAGWRFGTNRPNFARPANLCGSSGPLALGLPKGKAHPNGTSLFAEFKPAPDTTIAGYRVWRSAIASPSTPYAVTLGEVRGGQWREVERCWGRLGCKALGTLSPPFAPANKLETSSPAADISLVRFLAGCSNPQGTSCPSMPGTAAELRVNRVLFTINDPHLPVLTAPPAGPWFNSPKPLAGEQPVSIAATDRGGGVYQARFEVDGEIVQSATIDESGGACAAPFTRPAPCPLVAGGTVQFDTTAVADGEHELRILVSDAAGNTTPWGPVRIETRNAACDPGPPAAGLQLNAGIVRGASKRTRLTVGYRKRVRVAGRLTRSDGTPVGGAQLCVAEQVAGDAGRDVLPGPVTDADGRFSYRVRRGPSRALWIVHRVSGAAAAKKLSLKVRPRIKLRPSRRSLRNGDRLRFRGRISGPVPQRGALVQIQVDRGDHWQAFTSGRANRAGRFVASYRFSRTLGVASYRLRAHVPVQGAYPYASGSSRPVLVRVGG